MSRAAAAAAGAAACAIVLGAGGPSGAAPPPPRGPHPRVALTAATRAALKVNLAAPGSAAAAVIAACDAAVAAPGTPSGYQGLDWGAGASACALAYQMTGAGKHAARGIALWRALLEDVGRIGDRKACVVGASPKQARASVERDTGYAIRFVGLHAALAYDWLHDAPGVDEALRKQSRDCFRTWIDWYSKEGYLRDMPGANYHAGFLVAKTLIAIAASGEEAGDDAAGRFWNEIVDDAFGQGIVANGLAADRGGLPAGSRRGALVGGDWPEGWQYGPLSVIEYALAARALAEQGVAWPELGRWVDDLTERFIYGLTPARTGMYVGGDTEGEQPYLPPNAGPLIATLLGPGSDGAAARAAALGRALGPLRYGPPVFGALAEARVGALAEARVGAARPLSYLARGTRNLYARSSWDGDAFWAVFSSAPALVADHQHKNASSFVLSRGSDALIVDPSPYGSRSSLTGNALTVDSDVVKGDYKPSQTPWSSAELPFARGTASGVVAARAALAGAFNFDDAASDVPLALRDWVFLPEGEVVVLDRVVTGGARRRVYLRFRTPATLTLESEAALAAAGTPAPRLLARGRVGASALAIHGVSVRPQATPTVSRIAAGECPGSFGACAAARFPVSEYAVVTAGAEVLAAHVVDALAAGEAPAEVAPLAGADVFGVSLKRGAARTYVLAPAAPRALPPDTLSYDVPGDEPARHVVFDAPEGSGGDTSVVAAAMPDGRCRLALSASSGVRIGARPAIFRVAPAASGCRVVDEADAGPAFGAGAAAGGTSAPVAALPPGAQPRSKTVGGCGCASAGSELEGDARGGTRPALSVLGFGLGLGAALAAAAKRQRAKQHRHARRGAAR